MTPVLMQGRQGCVSTFSFKIRHRAWIDLSPVSAFATKSLENVMQGEKQQRKEKVFQDEVHVSAHRLMNSGVLSGSRQNPPTKRFQDLWQALLKLDRQHEVKWRWVKGHVGHPQNDRADELAVAARIQLQDSAAA